MVMMSALWSVLGIHRSDVSKILHGIVGGAETAERSSSSLSNRLSSTGFAGHVLVWLAQNLENSCLALKTLQQQIQYNTHTCKVHKPFEKALDTFRERHARQRVMVFQVLDVIGQ
eukprot:4553155-Amphidinium_carterae.1